ncbi:MAG: sugar ABC transporter substrate-binding protein [Propionicimonas sp.]
MAGPISRRSLIKASVAIGGAAALAACTNTGTAPTGGTGGGGPARLRFMTNHSTAEEALFRQAIEGFKSVSPDVTIDYLNIGDLASYQTKMKTLAAANDLPDVFYTRTAEVPSQAKLGWNLDLTEYANANADVNDIWPAQVGQMSYEGKLYGLPYDFSNQGIYYNKTMFEAEGIPLPTDELTWEELFAIAAAFKKLEGGSQTRWGIALRWDDWLWRGIFKAFGGGLLTEDQTASTANSAENIEAMRLFMKQIDDGVAPLLSALPTGVDPFAAGLVALQVNGSWATQSRRDNIGDAFEWDVVKLPKGPAGTRSISPNGGSWGVAAATAAPDAAQAFCAYLAAPEQQMMFIAEPMRGLPGRPSVAAKWEEIVKSAKVPPANIGVFPAQMQDDAIADTYPTFWQDVIASWTSRVGSSTGTVLTGSADVEAALQGLHDDIARAIF